MKTSLVPVDKAVDDLIGRKAREMNKSKAEILRMLIERGSTGEDGEPAVSASDIAKALHDMPESRPGSLAAEMKEMASVMMTINMMRMMNQPAPAPAAAHDDGTGALMRMMMIKEMTKPSIYDMMMIEKIGKGEEPSAALKAIVEEQRETREMMKELLGQKQVDEQIKTTVEPMVTKMTESVDALRQNQEAIFTYLQKGETAGKDTIEAYIANALKERLTDQVMDAVDKGLFQKAEVVNPATGQFNWQEVVNRMINLGEEVVKKMPLRTPAPALIRQMDGTFVNPVNGQVLTPEQAAQVMGISAAPIRAGPPPAPAQAPTEASPEAAATVEEFRRKKASQVTDTLMGQGAGEEQATEQQPEQQASEPDGSEQY